ncbi:hypothetical protein NUACC21_70020 [Scytonema sp. NUACC21]
MPLYVGKWHLDLKFLRKFGKQGRHIITSLMTDVYEQFDRLIEKDANIGLMYTHRADQLPFNYYVTRDYDTYLQDTKYEPQRCNVFAYIKNTYFFVALWYLKFLWKGFGITALLSPRNLYHVFKLLKASAESALDELIFKLKTKNLPASNVIAKARQEFESYQYKPNLQPWTQKVTEQSIQLNGKKLSEVPELVNLKAEVHS